MWVLPENVKTIINLLEENSHECYLVGGCVRDRLMGRKINDYDMATSASVEEMKKIFSSYELVLKGDKHGTVGVICGAEVFEITTFRNDGVYLDRRHPESVAFVSDFSQDAGRRDFTMNSIGYNPRTGFIDHYGGIQDIQSRIIRAVGDAYVRFEEDALRIMRAVRFSSQLGFTLDEKTRSAALSLAGNLKSVSKERLFGETKKLLMGEYAGEVLEEYMIILSSFIPHLREIIDYDQKNYHHNLTLSAHTAKVVASLPYDETLRLAGLFHDIAKPECATVDEGGIGHFYGHPARSAEMAREILTTLRCDNRTMEDVYTLVLGHDRPIEENRKSVKKVLAKIGERLFFMLMDLKIADNLAKAPEYLRTDRYLRIKDIAREIIAENECFSLRSMAVSGDDIISLGYPPSRKVGECLSYLLSLVLEGEAENEKEELTALAKEFMEM